MRLLAFAGGAADRLLSRPRRRAGRWCAHVPDDNWGFLSAQATILPKVLKPAGYHSAIVGKWNLGLESPNTPNDRGFDLFHGFLGDMMDDYWKHLRGGHNFLRLTGR